MKIDLDKVIEQYKPELKRVPLLVRYLNRIVHVKELNGLLDSYAHLGAIGFIHNSLSEMDITYSAKGLDELDINKRFIFASNHPFGGLDGIMLADIVAQRFGDVRVVVNDILMNVAPLKDIFIPVNKYGRQNLEYSKLYNDAFESDMPIITFPAGLVSRRKNGVISDSVWKNSFIKQAVTTERDVVPVFFDGGLSNFFYRLSSLRVFLGVKDNIEMIYLPNEMFKQAGAHYNVHFGKPISWRKLKEKNPSKAARMVREKAYRMKKKS